ncbi:MAG TPA: hypothetical protein PLX65_06340 [Accumulibacter sp.]|nr:hypothetical protein [Accumulibacter sp.]
MFRLTDMELSNAEWGFSGKIIKAKKKLLVVYQICGSGEFVWPLSIVDPSSVKGPDSLPAPSHQATFRAKRKKFFLLVYTLPHEYDHF